MNFKKEFSENQVVLAIVNWSNYNTVLAKNFKLFSEKKVCYVGFNKTCSAAKDWMEKNNVKTSKFVFIDAISRSISFVPSAKNHCYFVSSPAALTEISLLIDQLLKQDFEFFVLDSITNMFVYEKPEMVKKFLIRLINKIKETKTRAVFCTILSDEQNDFVKGVGMYFDKIIELK